VLSPLNHLTAGFLNRIIKEIGRKQHLDIHFPAFHTHIEQFNTANRNVFKPVDQPFLFEIGKLGVIFGFQLLADKP